jgi:hypothetical protein
MAERPAGEFETLIVRRSWIAGRPDGRRALLLETGDKRVFALEMTTKTIQSLQADLATLAALTPPPTIPNA